MLRDEHPGRPVAERIALGTTGVSVGLFFALVAVFVVYGSRLALAQAADSFSDVFTAIALLVSMRIAAQPADDKHPIGHQRAEPIAALVAAVIAGVLAVEVLRDAVDALLSGSEPVMGYPLLGVFVLKLGIKALIVMLVRSRQREHPSPALNALRIDAQNDVAVGAVAVAGFFAARYGWLGLDAWLAIPVALWIGWSGFDLARENIRLLMGESPDEPRRAALAAVAREVAGVRSVHHLRARYHGVELDVLLHVVVDSELSLRRAHDIGHAVEDRLIEERDVCHVVAHVDLEEDEVEGDSAPERSFVKDDRSG